MYSSSGRLASTSATAAIASEASARWATARAGARRADRRADKAQHHARLGEHGIRRGAVVIEDDKRIRAVLPQQQPPIGEIVGIDPGEAQRHGRHQADAGDDAAQGHRR